MCGFVELVMLASISWSINWWRISCEWAGWGHCSSYRPRINISLVFVIFSCVYTISSGCVHIEDLYFLDKIHFSHMASGYLKNVAKPLEMVWTVHEGDEHMFTFSFSIFPFRCLHKKSENMSKKIPVHKHAWHLTCDIWQLKPNQSKCVYVCVNLCVCICECVCEFVCGCVGCNNNTQKIA